MDQQRRAGMRGAMRRGRGRSKELGGASWWAVPSECEDFGCLTRQRTVFSFKTWFGTRMVMLVDPKFVGGVAVCVDGAIK